MTESLPVSHYNQLAIFKPSSLFIYLAEAIISASGLQLTYPREVSCYQLVHLSVCIALADLYVSIRPLELFHVLLHSGSEKDFVGNVVTNLDKTNPNMEKIFTTERYDFSHERKGCEASRLRHLIKIKPRSNTSRVGKTAVLPFIASVLTGNFPGQSG